MSQSTILEYKNVKATMLIPLYGRAIAGQKYPELVIDEEAVRIVSEIDYDFSDIEQTMGEMMEASYIIRAYNIDKIILRFIQKYPEGTIVNIGSGLDTTFSRIDNGKILWYNLVFHPVSNHTGSTAYFAICRVVVSQRRNHSDSFLRLAG